MGMKRHKRFFVTKGTITHTFYRVSDISNFILAAIPKIKEAIKEEKEIKGWRIIEDRTFHYQEVESEISLDKKPKKFILTAYFESIKDIARLLGKTELYCTQVFSNLVQDDNFDIDEIL